MIRWGMIIFLVFVVLALSQAWNGDFHTNITAGQVIVNEADQKIVDHYVPEGWDPVEWEKAKQSIDLSVPAGKR